MRYVPNPGATATPTDSTTQNVSGTATWTTSNKATATIAAGGLATTVGQGTTQIAAIAWPARP